MHFELSVSIKRPRQDVFMFLRDKDKYKQKKDSPVLLLEKTTAGSVGVGTRYREVVQMLPFYKGEIMSVITRYEFPESLEEDFTGAGMTGHLAYKLINKGDVTELIQYEEIYFRFPLNLLNPIVNQVFGQKLLVRLEEIKLELENKATGQWGNGK